MIIFSIKLRLKNTDLLITTDLLIIANKMMKQELIEKSNSSVYVIFVKKKDDRIRFYIDYN